VTRPKCNPPWDFLLTASRNSLQSYELTRLSHAANLRKEIGALLDQWLDENSCAMLARWLMENRERQKQKNSEATNSSSAPNPHSVSDNFFVDAIVDQALPPPLPIALA
jgi:hypothetical protein